MDTDNFLKWTKKYNFSTFDNILKMDISEIIDMPIDEQDFLMDFLLKFREVDKVRPETLGKASKLATTISNAMMFGIKSKT
ncbi:MAG: hypothetical protein LBV04_04910 [Deferribacteraceae bacterium]|jgi:hypothetical protein|nr:hypothetical protein [Deferribacteraceae bacterium]